MGEKTAIQREVDKYGAGKKKDDGKGDEGGDDDDEEGAEADGAEDATEEPKNNKDDKKKANETETVETIVEEEDLIIQPDLAASKAKYDGRKRLPLRSLPAEEYEERKIRKQLVVATRSKKKRNLVDWDEGK